MIKLLSHADFTKLEGSLHIFTYMQQAVMVILMYCGLRVGELILLTIKDLFLDIPQQHELHIRSQTTKTGVGRFIPIPHLASSILHKYIYSDRFFTTPISPQEYLFPGHAGRDFMSVHGIEQLVSKICLEVLSKHVTPHVLRHTYATKLLKHANIREVQMLLGHKKLSSTEIYTHPNIQDLTKAVNKTFS